MKTIIDNRVYILRTIRDYNTLTALLKEFNLELKSVKTNTLETEEGVKEVVVVTAEGDKNYLKFAEYLLRKEQIKTVKMLKKIKVKEFEIEKL